MIACNLDCRSDHNSKILVSFSNRSHPKDRLCCNNCVLLIHMITVQIFYQSKVRMNMIEWEVITTKSMYNL